MAFFSCSQSSANPCWRTNTGHNAYPQSSDQSTQNIVGHQSAGHQQSLSNLSTERAACSQLRIQNVISSSAAQVINSGANQVVVCRNQYTIHQVTHYQYFDPRTGTNSQFETVIEHQINHVQVAEYVPMNSDHWTMTAAHLNPNGSNAEHHG